MVLVVEGDVGGVVCGGQQKRTGGLALQESLLDGRVVRVVRPVESVPNGQVGMRNPHVCRVHLNTFFRDGREVEEAVEIGTLCLDEL